MKTIRIILFCLLLAMVPAVVSAEGWVRTYGGNNYDSAASIKETLDGGFIFAGATSSFGSGGYDAWIVKLDCDGKIEWQRAYGGNKDDSSNDICQTSDGGFVVAGSTESFGAGGRDVWVIKFDLGGNVEWQKTYGGSSEDRGRSILQTPDGGYILAGSSDLNAMMLKLDAAGNILWQKTFSGGENTALGALTIRSTADGGYVIAGFVDTVYYLSSSGTAAAALSGITGAWIAKLDAMGNSQWQRVYHDVDYPKDIRQTSDGGYIVAGKTFTNLGDAWVLKINVGGEIQWQRSYGGDKIDEAYSIVEAQNGTYVVGGIYNDGAWIFSIDASGELLWQKAYKGAGISYMRTLEKTGGGGYILAGGGAFVLKLDETGNIPGGCYIEAMPSAVTNFTNVVSLSANTTIGNSSFDSLDSISNASTTEADTKGICIQGTWPLPLGKSVYGYSATVFSSLDLDTSASLPIGVGPIAFAQAGSYLDLHIGLLSFEEPVDIYGAIALPSEPETLRVLDPDLSLKRVSLDDIRQALLTCILSPDIQPWKINISGPIDEHLFGKVPIESLEPGTYTLYLLASPTGTLSSYYLWRTFFSVP